MKQRLDKTMVVRGMVATRSSAENWIKLGKVMVNGAVAHKTGIMVQEDDNIELRSSERYVSRAGLKLASVARELGLTFDGKIVLDVGSSTGGFTDYVLQHGARKVIAVDVGTEQLHPSLRLDNRVELHEKTDIRSFDPMVALDDVVMDVSFVSARKILPHLYSICGASTNIIVMIKPQFEATRRQLTRGGIVKNSTVRREILKDFEYWVKKLFIIVNKADSKVAGAGGNEERFYLLKKVSKR